MLGSKIPERLLHTAEVGGSSSLVPTSKTTVNSRSQPIYGGSWIDRDYSLEFLKTPCMPHGVTRVWHAALPCSGPSWSFAPNSTSTWSGFRRLRNTVFGGENSDYLRGRFALDLGRLDEAESHFRTGLGCPTRPERWDPTTLASTSSAGDMP